MDPSSGPVGNAVVVDRDLLATLSNRLHALEKELGSRKEPRVQETTEYTKHRRALPQVNIMTLAEWDSRQFSLTQPHSVIDMVVRSSDAVARPPFTESDMRRLTRTESIEFVQINSPPYRHLCNAILGVEHGVNRFPHLIMHAPFRNLTLNQEEFTTALEALQRKWGPHTGGRYAPIVRYTPPDDPEEADDLDAADVNYYEPKDLTHESYEAYVALHAVWTFYEVYVKPRWDWLRSNQPDIVRYQDLRTIFQPGDVVFAPRSAQRCWKVTKVTGGRPKNKLMLRGLTHSSPQGESSVWEDDEAQTGDAMDREASYWTPLRIDGYYLDFDGRYRPVSRKEGLEYFAGGRSIKSLKIWPIRFAGGEKQYLTKPGKLFFQRCSPSLHEYHGRTLTFAPSGEPLARRTVQTEGHQSVPTSRPVRAQDIVSPVYVDFDKCFQYCHEWRPPSGLLDLYEEHDDSAAVDSSDLVNLGKDSNLRKMFISGSENPGYFILSATWPDKDASKRMRAKDRWLNSQRASFGDLQAPIDIEDQAIMPNRVFGFVFQTREWACFDVDPRYLKDVAPDATAWDNLQLPENHRHTLESLVELHFDKHSVNPTPNTANFSFDFIGRKGDGLVVLLHGPPGLGKTSTAEALSAKYQKPLLPITCGNLGTDSQSVEAALRDNFELAEAWDAIVLLDEADVFLSQRSQSDLQRNALVSVFLRTLEYYSGILFLTTNRTGAFDEAFGSRIHVSLYYPELGPDETLNIWRNNLDRLLAQRRPNDVQTTVENDGKDILAFARKHFNTCQASPQRKPWNGRQIRNAFQTALALADAERKRNPENKTTLLRAKHFESVADTSLEFERYWIRTREETDETLMDNAGLRAAGFQPSEGFDLESRAGFYPQPQQDGSHGNSNVGLQRRPSLNSRLPGSFGTQLPAFGQQQRPSQYVYGQVSQQQNPASSQHVYQGGLNAGPAQNPYMTGREQ